MDYVEFYYNQAFGCYPFDTDDNKIKTQKAIDYLQDAQIAPANILRVIEESPRNEYLAPENLPEWLWENSLLKPNTFYFHNLLHIKPNAPKFNPVNKQEVTVPFYLEMRIIFTADELISYFYRNLGITSDLIDRKRDAGSFNYLLNKYKNIDFVQPIDFVLTLIDTVKHHCGPFGQVTNVLQIAECEAEVHDYVRRKAAEAELANANQIIWR